MAATNPYAMYRSGLDSCAYDGVAITPDDNNDLTTVVRGIYVGGTGDVRIMTPAGTTLTFKNAQAGTVIPWLAARVKVAGTTATNLIGGLDKA